MLVGLALHCGLRIEILGRFGPCFDYCHWWLGGRGDYNQSRKDSGPSRRGAAGWVYLCAPGHLPPPSGPDREGPPCSRADSPRDSAPLPAPPLFEAPRLRRFLPLLCSPGADTGSRTPGRPVSGGGEGAARGRSRHRVGSSRLGFPLRARRGPWAVTPPGEWCAAAGPWTQSVFPTETPTPPQGRRPAGMGTARSLAGCCAGALNHR